MRTAPLLLRLAGFATGATSLLHLGIIAGGAEWYRFFGAGEEMARQASRGALLPTLVTLGIAAVLGIWSLYAFSGAGLVRRLPMLRVVLAAISAVFLARGVLGGPLVLLVDDPYLAELRVRTGFMVVTSIVCVALGVCYAVGAAAGGPGSRHPGRDPEPEGA